MSINRNKEKVFLKVIFEKVWDLKEVFSGIPTSLLVGQ